jgi:toxin secretion/phage lysis holin
MQELVQTYLQQFTSNADVKGTSALLGAALAAVFGGSVPLMSALVALWVLDFVLGFKRAWRLGRLSRHKFRAGLFKIVLYMITILVMGLTEFSLGNLLPIRDLMISYLCVTEALSCIEHLSFFGVPIPQALRDRLKNYRDCLHECQLPQGGSK